MKCNACFNDLSKHKRWSMATEYTVVCRRMHQKAPQWWEREPGWAMKNPVAELTRQSKRLWRHTDITFAEEAA